MVRGAASAGADFAAGCGGGFTVYAHGGGIRDWAPAAKLTPAAIKTTETALFI